MESHRFTLAGVTLEALAARALWLPETRALCVADLHLAKAERIARREGRLTPPYETAETLTRLADVIAAYGPRVVICLGDSFDDAAAAGDLPPDARERIASLAAGRRWVWIAGNHDPAPPGFGGDQRAAWREGDLVFRHIAQAGDAPARRGEVSGHYHPKVWLRGAGRPCFLVDQRRVVMPAFGLYTGGLDVADPAFDGVMAPDAVALMTPAKTGRIVAVPRAGLAAAGASRRRRAPVRRSA